MDALDRIKDLEERLRLSESQNSIYKKQFEISQDISSSLYLDLFMNMNVSCVIYEAVEDGMDFVFFDVNKIFERKEKINKIDLIGKKVSLTFPDSQKGILETFQAVYKTKKAQTFIYEGLNAKLEEVAYKNEVFYIREDKIVALYSDISEQKKNEEALIDSENRYKALANASNEAVFFMVDGFCIDANKAALKMFGLIREEVIGKHALSVIDESYHQVTIQNINNNYTKPYTSIAVHKDGHRFPVRAQGRVFQYKGKDTRITTIRDISGEKAKEVAILNSEERYRALADATSEAVFIMENGRCIDYNKQALKVYGFNPDEVIGIPILDLIAPQSKQLVSRKFEMEYAELYEVWSIRKNGEIFPAELRGKNFDYSGRKVRISTIRDISIQKQAELKLAKSETKFRSYFEDHTAIKLQIDIETKKIADVNKSAIAFYGYTKEELLEKTIFDLNALPKEEVLNMMKQAQMGEKNSFSFPHRLKSGELRDVNVYTTKIEVDGRDYFFSIMHDITDNKKVEEELKKSEARFRAYFENNNAAMLQIDPKTKQIIEANAAAMSFYGYSYEQFKNLTAYDVNILAPDEIDKKMAEVMAFPTQTFILNHRLASGDSCEVEVYVSPIKTDKESQLFITIYDVSEREAIKRALEANERNLIEAQRISKIGNWEYTYNPEGAKWSDETYNIFELDKSYVLNRETNRKLIHPEDIEAHLELVQQNRINKKPHHSIHRIITPSDKIKYVEEKGYTIYDKDDKPIKVIGTIQDITEQKLIETELQISKNYLQEAQRIAKVGHYEYDFRSQIVDWSEELSRIFGLDKENMKPDYGVYRSLIHKDDIEEVDRIYNMAKEEKRGFSIIYRIVTLQSEQKYLEEKGYFELDKNGTPVKVIGTMQDVTSNYIAKKALEESKKELAKINLDLEKRVRESIEKSREKDHILIQQSRHAVLGEMIGNIAHQWRQPLNEISILINDLEDAFSFGMLNKAYFDKTIDTVYHRLKYMSDTINDFSKMHTDDFKKEEFSPKQLIEKLIHFTAGSIKKDNIQIQLLTQDDFLCYGLPNMLSHIVLNLLNNSRDILSERKTKKPKIWIKLESIEDNYCIRVLDNGGGIEPEVIHKIFDPYFTTKDKKRGSGLGLYMVKSMVEKQMHGHVEVVNRRNGAEFKITLKLKIDETNG